MKIQYLSDIHKPIDLEITGDLVVVAGDLGDLDIDCLAVEGNREYYGAPRLRINTTFLECEEEVINGQLFIGCTLWTDARELHAINDINYVPFDIICKWHQQQCAWLWRLVAKGRTKDAIIITHHAPSFKSENDKFNRLTPAFCNNMDALVKESGAKIWIHGHTHSYCDYYIGNTRVVSNPVGYIGENTGYQEGKTIEI